MEGNKTNDPKENNKIEIHLENINNQENETIPHNTHNLKQKEEQKEKEKNVEEEKKQSEKELEEEKYDLNKDYNFLSILQFVNLFHKVLGLNQISTTEFEFSLLHTDIDPLCCNILSKLLLKKEQHRPTKKNNDKDKEKEKDNNNAENNIHNSN